MPFFNQRKRLAAIAEAEARGESFWTTKFDGAVRNKLGFAIRDASPTRSHVDVARELLLRDEGLVSLTNRANPADDFFQYLLDGPDDVLPSLIEAVAAATNMYVDYQYGKSGEFHVAVNRVFRHHRIAYDLIDGEMIPYESRELHQEVVVPTLQLPGNKAWASVEKAYRKALEELSHGDAADAITDAGTALQEAFVLAGCKGNALGPLAKDAKARGLLAPHDETLADALQKIVDWVSADRSTKGDAHNASSATRSDAWLTVHVVGALILRLSEGTSRTTT